MAPSIPPKGEGRIILREKVRRTCGACFRLCPRDPIEKQVLLCATAYNHGVKWEMPKDELLEHLYEWSSKKFFHLELMETPFTTKYSYAEIAYEWYQNRRLNVRDNRRP